jgi:aerobic-type carbon monoxide dehydrogenase small subunit (CoxS/CutS family)
MLMAAHALLEKNGNPSEEEIRNAISGNICRCTGYVKVIESVRYAARLRGRQGPAGAIRSPGRRSITKARSA